MGSYFIFPGVKSFVDEAFSILTSDDEEAVQEWVSRFGIWGPVMVIVLMVAQMFLFVIPNILLMMIAIISYGPVWGGLLAWAGVFASSSTGYYIGSKLGRIALYKFVGERTQQKMIEFVRHYGMGAILVTRLSSFSNDALGFVAGALKMGYFRYIVATLTGIAPLIILLAIYGRNGKIEKALLWISLISLVLLTGYILIDKKRKKQKESLKSKTTDDAGPGI